VTATGTRQAHLEGFDLHANVAVAANNRDGLEHLARYVLRPPIAQERLMRTADGRVLLSLKTEWSDGTTHLLFEPIELLERLAALTPRPRINLVLHHGVLAPHSRWRARAVAYGRDTPAPLGPDAAVACGTVAPPVLPGAPRAAGGVEASGAVHLDPVVPIGKRQSEPASFTPAANPEAATTAAVEVPPPPAPRKWSWPDLMRHTFAVDVGLPPLWRPQARGGHHRGPPRHPEDSHPPRAPDRGVGAPAAAVRPVRLELKSAACRCRLSRADARGVSAGRIWRLATARSGSRRRAWCHRETPPGTRPPDHTLRRSGRAAGW
jgi:hypothetical protein